MSSIQHKIEENAPLIKRFKMKPTATIEELMLHGFKPGGVWLDSRVEYYLAYSIKINDCNIGLDIGVPLNLNEWNDIDFICVLDMDFLQPYIPFYNVRCKQNKGITSENFDILDGVIKEYNTYLSSLDFLEEIVE